MRPDRSAVDAVDELAEQVAMREFQPMKAPSRSITASELPGLAYPILASPKLDALRAVGHSGGIRSKTLTPFRNTFINRLFEDSRCGGLDGELAVGDPYGSDVLRRAMSGITSKDGEPDVHWFLFDDFSKPSLDFETRNSGLRLRVRAMPPVLRSRIVVLEQVLCHCADDVLKLEQKWLALGYEGAMLRALRAIYKFGRATWNEGSSYKFKRFEDAEATVVSYVEGSHNENEAERKPDGSVKRSTAKSGMVKSGLVGAILAKDALTGRPLEVSPGTMTKKERAAAWEHRQSDVGRIFTYKHFPYGAGEAGRHMTFKAWRDEGL